MESIDFANHLKSLHLQRRFRYSHLILQLLHLLKRTSNTPARYGFFSNLQRSQVRSSDVDWDRSCKRLFTLSPGGEEMFGEVAGSVIRWVSVFPLGNQLVSRGVDLVPSTYKPASPLEFNEKRLAPNRPAPLTCSITNAKTSKLPRYAYTSS